MPLLKHFKIKLIPFLFIGLSFSYITTYSSDKAIADSLWKYMDNKELTILKKLFFYQKIAYYEPNPDRMLIAADSLVRLGANHFDINNNTYKCLGYNFKGIALRYKGDYVTSLNTLHRGLESAGSDEDKALLLSSLGDVNAEGLNFEQALDYYMKSIAFHETTVNKCADHAQALINLGDTYIEFNQPDSALFYLNQVPEVYEIEKDQIKKAYWTGNIGIALALKEEYKEAEVKISEAVDVLEENKDYYAVSIYFMYLSDIYRKRGNYSKAVQYAERSLELARVYDLKDEIAKSNKLISELSEELGDYKRSLEALKEYLVYEDSIHNKEVIREMADMHTEYEVSQKQAEVNLLNLQNKNKERLLTIALIVLVLVLIVAVLIYRSYLVNRRLSQVNLDQAEQLRQLDQAKSRFFANISHDLRSPMTLIMGGIRQVLSLQDLYLTTQAEELLQTAALNGERIIHMTQQINELSRMEDAHLQLNKQYLQVDKVLHQFQGMFKDLLHSKGIHMTVTNSCSDPPILHVDPHYLEKLLFNLISNAIKHTQEGDHITLTVSQRDGDLILSVIDTGEGIPSDKLPYLFERYYQVPEKAFQAREGFGIGLSLVREIVTQHGGHIEVESEIGKGSTFQVTLPHSQDIAVEELYTFDTLSYSEHQTQLYSTLDRQVPILQSDLFTDHTRQTVLLVEDHSEVRAYIKALLDVDYHVLQAPDGKQALHLLEDHPVDLILTDLMMPILDGFELLEKLREEARYHKIPVLVVSARSRAEDHQKVLGSGVNDYLPKPFDPVELQFRIKNLLSQRALWADHGKGFTPKATLDELEKALLKQVEQQIVAKIDDVKLSVSYLASEIAVSERKYYRMIKKLTGLTPLEHIREVRLQLAMKLIGEKTLQNATELAHHVGIPNVTRFSAQFQKRFGKKPADMLN